MVRIVAAASTLLMVIGISACTNTQGGSPNEFGYSGTTVPTAGTGGISFMASQWGMGSAIPPPGSPNTGA